MLSSYSSNLYYKKGKDMILSDFLYRQKHDNINPHEITPISFNIQKVLQTRCYNISEKEQRKYLVQTRLHGKISGSILPEVHGIEKGIDPNVRPEKKQVINPVTTPKHIYYMKQKIYLILNQD